MIDTKLLRQKLIDIAMRGLLVEQRQEEGNASDLLEQIRAEKAALIKKGQIKKEKPLPEIKEEEKPFTIPANWCWVRLGEIVEIAGGKRLPRGHKFSENPTSHIYIRVSDMKNCTIVSNSLSYISDDTFEHIQLYTIGKDDIYLTIAGTIGRVGIVPIEFDKMNLTENAVKLTQITIEKLFVLYVLCSQFVQSQFTAKTNKVAQPKLAIQRIATTLVPLPPLAEQKRIVAALEASLKLVDTIAKDSVDLDKALKFLRQKVLDMAMRGLLVEQRPEDGNATDLLEQIRAEKVALIKKGQIKKEKPLPEIKEEEKPFAIPDSWCWVRLGEIGSWAAGATPSRGFADYYKGNIPWLKTGDLNDGYILFQSLFLT